jgi:hypothetical protein
MTTLLKQNMYTYVFIINNTSICVKEKAIVVVVANPSETTVQERLAWLEPIFFQLFIGNM